MTNCDVGVVVLIDDGIDMIEENIKPSPKALKLATVAFNPSNDRRIDFIKIVSAALIQLIEDHGHGRSASIAKTKTQEAKMWGVQSVIDKTQSDAGQS